MNAKLILPLLKFWLVHDSKSAGSLLLRIYADRKLKEAGEAGRYLVHYYKPTEPDFGTAFDKLVDFVWKHDSDSLCEVLFQLTPFLSDSLRKHIGKHYQLLYEDSLYDLTNVSRQAREARIAQHCCSCWRPVKDAVLGPANWVYCAACHKKVWEKTDD